MMLFPMTPAAKAKALAYKADEEARKATITNLSDENLVATAKFFMQNMTPIPWVPGEPVYDATMWHIVLPELLRRLSEGAQ